MVGSWYLLANRCQKRAEDGFEHLGRAVVRHPSKTILSVVLFTILCACGFLNFQVLTDGQDLWIPQDSQAQRDLDYVSTHYGDDSAGMSVLLSDDTNLISLEIFEEFWNLNEAITTSVSASGKQWKDVCKDRDYSGSCMVLGPLQFWSSNRSKYTAEVSSVAELQAGLSARTFPDGSKVNRDLLFGKYTVDGNDTIISTKGFIQFYYIQGSDSFLLDWMEAYLEMMDSYHFGSSAEFYYFSDRSLDDELARSIGGDILLVTLTYIIMITFTCLVMAKKFTCHQTRNGLSMSGVLIIIMGIIAGYGLSSGLGIPFIVLHQILPFIVVGVGVDDIFILVNTFDALDASLSIEERMAKAMRKCGLSVLYTTATDVAAFLLGASSSLPAIQAFCLYAAFTLLFNFIFQMTAFASLLGLDTARMEAGRVDVLCCLQACSKSEDNNVNTNGDDDGHDDDGMTNGQTCGAIKSPQPSKHSKPVDSKSSGSLLKWIVSEYYVPVIAKLPVRIAVVAAFLGILGFSIYGVTNIKQGFDLIDLVPDDSYARLYILEARSLDLFLYESNVPTSIYFKDIEYSSEEAQLEMLRAGEELLNGRYNQGPLTSWFVDFSSWVESDESSYSNMTNNNGHLTNSSIFYAAVGEFLNTESYALYNDDVKLRYASEASNETIGIITSRISAYHVDQRDPYRQIRTMTDARDLADSLNVSPGAFAYSRIYLFAETEVLITLEMSLNLVLALVAVAAVSFFVLIRPSAVLLVSCLLVMVDVDIIGTMYYWNLNINTVTVVQLVMAVGLVVDYMSHILHAYLVQPWDISPEERVSLALIEMGPSIFMGCSTTFLGILPLVFANSAIFRIFFRMFFCIIVFGAGHGLVLLPAILPWIPFSDVERCQIDHQVVCAQEDNEKEVPQISVDKEVHLVPIENKSKNVQPI